MKEESKPEKQKNSNKVWIILFIVTLVALIALGIYGFVSMRRLNKQISDQKSQINELNDKKKTLEDAVAVATKTATDATAKAVANTVAGSDDDQTIAAAKNYCEAEINPQTGKARVFILGTTGPNGKRVTYAGNKTFAEISAGCTNTSTEEGSSSLYILKKVNSTWVVIDRDQQVNPEKNKLYGIPTNFQ